MQFEDVTIALTVATAGWLVCSWIVFSFMNDACSGTQLWLKIVGIILAPIILVSVVLALLIAGIGLGICAIFGIEESDRGPGHYAQL